VLSEPTGECFDGSSLEFQEEDVWACSWHRGYDGDRVAARMVR
jgi:hypothetical protein